ncbi:outer membrane beta-barrel protein [Litoribrevibacter albus]|uniref:Capsular polysaccharide biosynthesis protein n=1 Tax=Litoribrevibacter albus TaxID=1473156 RepID=A0AA37S8Z2_9GAMM|nr:outer membrane beta-barrel protein [Litoribrevibacter albus]GLQ30287.1 capsular polysaccharide biosynthesis protein [Litoribrevibacter albus]
MPTFSNVKFSRAPLSLSLLLALDVQAAEPATFNAGIFTVTPQATLESMYDDNIFSQESKEKASLVSILNPSVEAVADDGFQKYTLGYSFDAGWYENSTDDNYLDHSLFAQGDWFLNQTHQLAAEFSLFSTHEDRGTGFSQGGGALTSDSPDKYVETTLSGVYTFGGIKTKGRLETELEYYDKRYTNHRDLTVGRDRVDISLGETFFWAVSGSTDALFELVYVDVDYDNDPSSGSAEGSLDSRVIKAYTGATWELSGKTEGTVKIGYADKAFDDRDRDDFSGLSWEASVTWLPKSYSVVTFTMGRRQDEAYGSGDYIDGKDIGVAWKHDWKERFSTQLAINYSNEDYKGDPSDQEDNLFDMEFSANYEMRRWLTLGASYLHETRNSNQSSKDYDRNVIALNAEVSL